MIASPARRSRILARASMAALVIALGFATAAHSQPGTNAAENTPRVWPGDARANLDIPADVWGEICAELGRDAHAPLGLSADDMANFPADPHRLRLVDNSFRDVRGAARFSGRLADLLLHAGNKTASLATLGFALLDTRAMRDFDPAKHGEWHAEWLADRLSPNEAICEVMGRGQSEIPNELPPALAMVWDRLPLGVQRLVVRLAVAAFEAVPYLREAVDAEFILAATGRASLAEVSWQDLYALATHPWLPDAAPHRRAFEAIDRLDMAYLAAGTIRFFTHVDAALAEFESWRTNEPANWQRAQNLTFTPLRIPTALGAIALFDARDSHAHANGEIIAIDLGGNDLFHGRWGTPASLAGPIGFLLDIAGNDEFVADSPAAIGCGLFGVGAIVDLAGNDSYDCAESGVGAAWHGTGLILDAAGDDSYRTDEIWGQGAAHVGVAMCVDLAGDDRYFCNSEAQGFGGTRGAGLLVDAAGNDRYRVNGDRFTDETGLSDSAISLVQGVGFGRRADFDDGHYLAGGVGAFIEGAGNDDYEGHAFTKGVGYWWAMGIFEDVAGDDVYSGEVVSFGAAMHYGVGCFADRTGNDRYNPRADRVAQSFGHARDASIAVCIDGDGHDEYRVGEFCAGSSDLTAIGLFWDRRGDDRYVAVDSAVFAGRAAAFGFAAAAGANAGTFRARLPQIGIFLDTAGTDEYPMRTDSFPHAAIDNADWFHAHALTTTGFGRDTEVYAAGDE